MVLVECPSSQLKTPLPFGNFTHATDTLLILSTHLPLPFLRERERSEFSHQMNQPNLLMKISRLETANKITRISLINCFYYTDDKTELSICSSDLK